jgi:hypothetical protein
VRPLSGMVSAKRKNGSNQDGIQHQADRGCIRAARRGTLCFQSRNFAAKYLPSTDADNGFAAASWSWFSILKQTLRQCGADLSRENIITQAANINSFIPPLSLSNVTFNTSRTNFRGFNKMAINVFDGEHRVRTGDVIGG